jgi:hypothetical protein
MLGVDPPGLSLAYEIKSPGNVLFDNVRWVDQWLAGRISRGEHDRADVEASGTIRHSLTH